MSSSSEALVSIVQQVKTTTYVTTSLVGLIVYELLITFDQEVSAVWQKKITATSLLLLSTRWIMLLNSILTCIGVGPSWCKPIDILGQLTFLATTVLISSFSALRVYALWQESRLKYALPLVVLLLGLVPVGTNIYGWVHTTIVYEELLGTPVCGDFTNIPEDLNRKLLFLTRSSVIAADAMVLVLTWAKTFRVFSSMRQLGVGSSISAVLLRNGTIYFIALLVINILQLVTYSATFSNISYVVSCVQFMPPLLVQRFMLNLRQHGSLSEEDDSEPRNGTCSGTLNFRSPTAQSDFLGNIGEPLVHGSEMRAEAEIWDEEERHGPPVEGSTEGTGTESTRWPGPAPLRDVLGSFDGLQGGSGGPELATCACEAACGALLCKRL